MGRGGKEAPPHRKSAKAEPLPVRRLLRRGRLEARTRPGALFCNQSCGQSGRTGAREEAERALDGSMPTKFRRKSIPPKRSAKTEPVPEHKHFARAGREQNQGQELWF